MHRGQDSIYREFKYRKGIDFYSMPFLLFQKYLCFSELTLLILTPTLDANVVQLDIAEGIDECRRKATVGDERHVEVDGSTTNLVSVGELTGSEVLRDVHPGPPPNRWRP